MTLPQEHFDLIERAAVSKPPQRILNPRFVRGTSANIHSLNSGSVARDGASTMTFLPEGEILCRSVLPEAYRLCAYRLFITVALDSNTSVLRFEPSRGYGAVEDQGRFSPFDDSHGFYGERSFNSCWSTRSSLFPFAPFDAHSDFLLPFLLPSARGDGPCGITVAHMHGRGPRERGTWEHPTTISVPRP